jgi:hypothetical protein
VKVNEIRCGNYILNREAKIIIVNSITIRKLEWCVKQRGYFTGIFLTPFFIERLGFKLAENSSTWFENGSDISISSNGYVAIRFNGKWFSLKMKLKYVHEFQNLYFAHTKKELTFTDEQKSD